MKTVEAFNAFHGITGTVPAAIAGNAPMSEAIVWQACPQRLKSQDEDVVLAFTKENVRKLLGGSRLLLARGILKHLSWAFTRGSGGVVDPDGDRRVWKSAGEFAEEAIKAAQGVLADYIPSNRTFDRALAGLVRLGVLIRDWINLPQGRTSIPVYAYKPGPNWSAAVLGLEVSQGLDNLRTDPNSLAGDPDTAVAQTESSSELPSEQPSDPIGCAALSPEPAEPESELEEPFREKPVKRPKRVAADDDLWPLDVSKQSLTTPPVQEAAPVEQTEPTSEDKGSDAPLNLLNGAVQRGWQFNPQRMLFVHASIPARSVEKMAEVLKVAVDELWAAVDHLIPV